MAKSTKMTTGKKVAIAAGVTAVVGAILCYFYCPCFKKGGAAEGDVGIGSDGIWSGGVDASISIPQPLTPVSAMRVPQVKAALLNQRGIHAEPYII